MLANYLNDPVPSSVAEIFMVRQRMRSLVGQLPSVPAGSGQSTEQQSGVHGSVQSQPPPGE